MYFEDIFFWTYLGILLQFLMVCAWFFGMLYCVAKITKYRHMFWGFCGCLGMMLCTLGDLVYNMPQLLTVFWNHITEIITAQARVKETWDYLHLYYRWEGMQIALQIFLVAALAGHFKQPTRDMGDTSKATSSTPVELPQKSSGYVATQAGNQQDSGRKETSPAEISAAEAEEQGQSAGIAAMLAAAGAATADEDKELAAHEQQQEQPAIEDGESGHPMSSAEVEEGELPGPSGDIGSDIAQEKTVSRGRGKAEADDANDEDLRAIKEEETLQDYNIKKDFMEARPGDFTMAMLDKNAGDIAPEREQEKSEPAEADAAKPKVVPWIFPTTAMPLKDNAPRIQDEPEDQEEQEETKRKSAAPASEQEDDEYLETGAKAERGAKKKAPKEESTEEDDEYMDIAEEPKKPAFKKLQKKKFGEESAEDNGADADKKFRSALLKNLIPEGGEGEKKPKKGK